MNLMFEDLARAHTDARLSEAREQRRSVSLSRMQRLARRAERVSRQAERVSRRRRLALDRSM